MLNIVNNELKDITKNIQQHSIDNLKRFLKSQIVLKADEGELSVSENISKDIDYQDICNLSDEFKQAGYKVQVHSYGDQKIFSVFWN
jgi:hypothetical protein